MGRGPRIAAIAVLAFGLAFALGTRPGAAQSRAHVYLFRGLADVFSTGMDTLADEINRRGVAATSLSHTDWKVTADRIAVAYKAGKEGPIILVGHSLGADAVMEMADYLGDKFVPVALVVPFDGTQSFPAPGNVARVINFTQRDYAHMRAGPGFRGSLVNVDLSADHSIDHLNIDKSPRLHARVIEEVLAVVGGRAAAPAAPKRPPVNAPAPRGAEPGAMKSEAETAARAVAHPEVHTAPASAAVPAAPVAPPPRAPPAPRIDPSQIPD
jgi:pimeloyl-ACP methyl ester carboxylesterase